MKWSLKNQRNMRRKTYKKRTGISSCCSSFFSWLVYHDSQCLHYHYYIWYFVKVFSFVFFWALLFLGIWSWVLSPFLWFTFPIVHTHTYSLFHTRTSLCVGNPYAPTFSTQKVGMERDWFGFVTISFAFSSQQGCWILPFVQHVF